MWREVSYWSRRRVTGSRYKHALACWSSSGSLLTLHQTHPWCSWFKKKSKESVWKVWSKKWPSLLCGITLLAHQLCFSTSQQSVSSTRAATFSSWHTNPGSDDQNDLNWDSFPLTSATCSKQQQQQKILNWNKCSSSVSSGLDIKRDGMKKWDEADFFIAQTVKQNHTVTRV